MVEDEISRGPRASLRAHCNRFAVLVQSFSHVRLFAAPWAAARQASLSFTISRSLFKLLSFELVMMPANHL